VPSVCYIDFMCLASAGRANLTTVLAHSLVPVQSRATSRCPRLEVRVFSIIVYAFVLGVGKSHPRVLFGTMATLRTNAKLLTDDPTRSIQHDQVLVHDEYITKLSPHTRPHLYLSIILLTAKGRSIYSSLAKARGHKPSIRDPLAIFDYSSHITCLLNL
jgi:hypothetical protein